ncbi:hypothetical protein LIP55_01680 [[Ruminococcus] gnavus]|nr:hypothetical protein [Mediterraneibacter gnavus]
MTEFEGKIAKAVEGKLNDGTVEKIVENYVEKAISESVRELFSWNGSAKKIINSKCEEVLIPAIERMDLNKQVVKLDEVLTGIIETTGLADNKKILENFRTLMTEPIEGVVDFEELFEKYKEYVGENIDTDKLEVYTDEAPCYQDVTVDAEVEMYDGIFGGRSCDVIFKCHEDDDLEKRIHFYSHNNDGRYSVCGLKDEININSLRYTSEFDIYMMTIDRVSRKVIHICDMRDDCVEVQAKPEAKWS